MCTLLEFWTSSNVHVVSITSYGVFEHSTQSVRFSYVTTILLYCVSVHCVFESDVTLSLYLTSQRRFIFDVRLLLMLYLTLLRGCCIWRYYVVVVFNVMLSFLLCLTSLRHCIWRHSVVFVFDVTRSILYLTSQGRFCIWRHSVDFLFDVAVLIFYLTS